MKKIQKILFYLFVIYGIFGFFIFPYILKPQLIKLVEQKTDAKIKIQKIYFNPFVFNMEISSVRLQTKDNQPLVSLKSVNFDFELYSLFNSAIHVKRFVLKEPKIYLTLNKDKSINIAKIIKPTSKKTTPKKDDSTPAKLPRVILDRVAVEDGTLYYKDFTQKSEFNFVFSHIGFELKDIDTKKLDSQGTNIRFYSMLEDGGFIDLKSKIHRVNPLALSGSLNFEASKLYTQWRYLKDSLNLEVADGKITFYTQYQLDLNDINSTTLKNLSLSLNKLRVKPKKRYKDVLNINSLSVKDATIKPFLQDIYIKNIVLESLYVKAKRDANAKIDWLDYLKIKTEKKPKSEPLKTKETKQPWHLQIKDIALKNIKADFDDSFVKPSVTTKLNTLNIYLQDVTLAGEKPLTYQINTKINDTFTCNAKGSLIHKNLLLKSSVVCKGFDLVHYNPYIEKATKDNLKLFDLKLKSTIVGFDANATISDKQQQIAANIYLDKFALNKKSTKQRLLDFKKLSVKKLYLDTLKKDINIQNLTIKNLNIKTKRLKNNKLNIENLFATKEVKKQKHTTKSSKNKDYTFKLKHASLRSAQLDFKDEALLPTIKNKIDKINLDIYNISSNKTRWINYNLTMRINKTSTFKTKGKLKTKPLTQKGDFKLTKFSLKDINPYIQQKAFVNIDDGLLSLKGKTNYAPNKNSADLKLLGSLQLESFFLSDSRDKTPLLSFSNVSIDPFTYEMSPNRLFMEELTIDSFYVNAIVNKNKQMNFASLIKPVKESEDNHKEDTQEKQPFPIKIMKLNVKSGSAKFADLSLPIEFRTDIHDLNGVVYAISNQKDETSFVDISGEVDKYGSTKLRGSINAGNPKKYTDLDFNFRNLELNSVSGYSASFVGYKIDSGKLYLDLGYDILDSQLVGKNNIIIKNIKLGDEIKDENTTSMPLGFIIALLEDSDGIIDIDMPVEGDVDQPDFKYGKLVWKTFANLLIKAVTSPFRFLGSMMGIDSQKLESVDFEPGLANLLPPEKEKLDTIAKMMIKRPKIALCISAKYDDINDKEELQRKKLIALAIKKSGVKNADQHENIMTIKLLEEIYADLKNDDKIKQIKEKLKESSNEEKFNQLYLNALVDECTKIQPLNNDELESLSNMRKTTITNYLLNEKSIDPARVKTLKNGNTDEHDEKWVKTKLQITVP